MLKLFGYAAGGVVISYLALFAAIKTFSVPEPLPIDVTQPVSQLADPAEALTFARVMDGGTPHLLLVTRQTDTGADAIDLTALSTTPLDEPFDAIDLFGRDVLVQMVVAPDRRARDYAQDTFLPAASGAKHIAFGTNFADHGAEVRNETPFRFPRLNAPTASVTEIAIDPKMQLIDYEVELCMRFDRPIATLQDFEDAQKIVFLCGDFSDRKVMLEGMPEGEDTISGIGFTDAKSLPGFFPTGPFMVVPRDWKRFLADEEIGTSLNGAPMQHTSGDKMVVDFRGMVALTLQDGTNAHWTSKGAPVSLLPTGRIEAGQVLLSGTTGGVLFRPPSKAAIALYGAKYGMTGGFLTKQSGYRSVINDSIQATFDAGIMLQPGDEVIYHSSRLGKITSVLK